MRTALVLAVVLLSSGSQGALAQYALGNVTDPEPLNSDAATDTEHDVRPQLETDGAGNWVVVWESEGILVSHSLNGGVSWSDPEAVIALPSATAARIATDGQGAWIVVCADTDDGTIYISRGTENGVFPPTWSPPEALNPGGPPWSWSAGNNPTVAHDGAGTWVVLWYSSPESWIIRSTDGGVNWTAPELFPIREPEVSSNVSGTLIAIGPLGTSATVVSRSTDGGASWSTPLNVTTGTPRNPAASDGAGNWILVSAYYFSPGSEPPFHVRYARSEDDGVTWTAGTVAFNQQQGATHPDVATDGEGNWLVVWDAEDTVGPHEIWLSRSTDRAVLWSAREKMHDLSGYDAAPRIKRDANGHWVVVWESFDGLAGSIGPDADILTARITLLCDDFEDDSSYGKLLFEPMCARHRDNLAQDSYGGTEMGIQRNADDVFYLSSEGDDFAPLVAGDVTEVNGVDSGLGPYGYQPPPFNYYAPIETTLIPEPSHDVTDLIPLGSSQVSFDLLANDVDEIYGNTPIYLVRDCGLIVTNEGDEVQFVTHDDSIAGTPPEFDVRSGLLSDLRADGDLSQAVCLGHFFDNPATLGLPDPPEGDGYYYLARGLSSCVAEGYGSSGLDPDPRDALDTLPACP